MTVLTGAGFWAYFDYFYIIYFYGLIQSGYVGWFLAFMLGVSVAGWMDAIGLNTWVDPVKTARARRNRIWLHALTTRMTRARDELRRVAGD